MHPRDHTYDHRRERAVQQQHGDARDSRAPAGAWKEWAHSDQHHALLPLPVSSSTSIPSIPSIHYDRRRAELFPSEHKMPALQSQSPAFFHNQRRPEYAATPVFQGNYQYQEHRHQPHYQHHIDSHYYRDESRPIPPRYPTANSASVNLEQPTRSPARGGKGSLAFILDGHHGTDAQAETEQSLSHLHLHDASSRDDNEGDSSDTSLERYTAASLSGSERRSPPAEPGTSSGRKGNIKKSRICKVDNCTRYVVNKGLCIGHGGGKRCAIAGCTSSAKNLGVCWKHGGSTKCTVENCENRAKSRGVCWSHGGGRKCKEDGCTKTAVSNGLCWAHGGGKRCVVDGCKKPAYERNGNLCTLHKGGAYATSA